MPAIRYELILCTLCLFLVVSSVDAQDRGRGFGPPKTLDGRLTDWGNGKPYSPDYAHLYENEAQWLDNWWTHKGPPSFPVGAPYEEPLNMHLSPDYAPMGSGFNIVSGLACYDPGHKGGTYWIAVDLPGPTNDLLSEGFYNKHAYTTKGIILYPLPFDADCNEDRLTVYPGLGGLSESNREVYQITLWVGGDHTLGWNYSGSPGASPYNGPGFPIFVVMEEFRDLFKPFSFEAFIPAPYLKYSGSNLDLTNVGGKTLAFHSNPHVGPEYDIEVEINGIRETILPLIDQDQLQQKVTMADCARAYIELYADSNGDESDEELVIFGLNAFHVPKSPPPPWVRKAW